MRNKLKPLVRNLLAVAFWLLVWELSSLAVNNSYFLPDIGETLAALGDIFSDKGFAIIILMTFARVISGLLLGAIFGVIMGWLSLKSDIVNALLKPVMLLVKSTPVASFIILLYAKLSGNALSIFIALLMVFPIICESTASALKNIDRELEEVCVVFKFSTLKRIRHLVVPTMLKFLVPAIITSVGLAWKAEVAAEIVGYVTNSIGSHINDASGSDTATVFAWTLLIIVFSVVLEGITRHLLRRIREND